MLPRSRLADILSEFRPLFKYNNFKHFQTFVICQCWLKASWGRISLFPDF